MTLPIEHVNELLEKLNAGLFVNLEAQADARRVFQEVKEDERNYPRFDSNLTEKATHIAYSLLAAGCSILEQNQPDTEKGIEVLERAGKVLSDVYRYNIDQNQEKNINLLLAGMSLFCAKQFSRAFIVLDELETEFAPGIMISEFIKKDFDSLLDASNESFFSEFPKELNIRVQDEWIISHEIARCFMIVLNYLYTGDSRAFSTINRILNELIELSKESGLSLYWLIIRLLRIMFRSFEGSSLWDALPPVLPMNKTSKKYIRLLSELKAPVTELWPSQKSALHIATGENEGGVVNLRTSGGKTRVAEIAILDTLLKHEEAKILYLAPFRSLAFEIEQSLHKIFSPLDISISQLYGGATANTTDLELIKESQIIIATPEKAKAIIRAESSLEANLKLVVIDEGHLIGADVRHVRNEIFLTHINEFASRNDIRMILLSAVLPNAEQVAEWIAGDAGAVAKSDWKPASERLGHLVWNGEKVRLSWLSEGNPFNPKFVEQKPLGFSRRRLPFPNDKNEAIAATALRLSESGTVMIFTAQARSVNPLARCVLLALGEHPDDFPWPQAQWNTFENICKEDLGADNIVLAAARKGVICHSNKLTNNVRIALEVLMRSAAPKIIIATSTLGQGVNVGISSVIISSTDINHNHPIGHRDFWNICGRAGRAFSDAEGKILFAIDETKPPEKVRKDYRTASAYFQRINMERVESGLLWTLRRIYMLSLNCGLSFENLIEQIANDTLGLRLSADDEAEITRQFDAIDDELLSMHQDFGDEENIDWVDDVFRNSLALIQSNEDEKFVYSEILSARTKALLIRTKNPFIRGKIISSGIPFSIAEKMMEHIDFFKEIGNQYINDVILLDTRLDAINLVIEQIELWCFQHATQIIGPVFHQPSLNNIRKMWLNGTPMVEIRIVHPEIDEIVKKYYGFSLPWIIHGISRMFDPVIDEELTGVYSRLASYVELGLSTDTAINIFLSGIRSRTIAVELGNTDLFENLSISQIREKIFGFPYGQVAISEEARNWLNLFSRSKEVTKQEDISFPSFTFSGLDKARRLYVRKVNDKYYLTISDGYEYSEVHSTEDLPFEKIANIRSLYFRKNNNTWSLKSWSPKYNIR